MVLEAARLALTLGVPVDTANARGDTALHAAAARGYDSVIELLVANGADVGLVNADGQTPLDIARRGSRRLGIAWATPKPEHGRAAAVARRELVDCSRADFAVLSLALAGKTLAERPATWAAFLKRRSTSLRLDEGRRLLAGWWVPDGAFRL